MGLGEAAVLALVFGPPIPVWIGTVISFALGSFAFLAEFGEVVGRFDHGCPRRRLTPGSRIDGQEEKGRKQHKVDATLQTGSPARNHRQHTDQHRQSQQHDLGRSQTQQ
jgi:hypothetical protein